jgi:DtxR family transcriptional regulator, Mn-dependent transcriptional regulator
MSVAIENFLKVLYKNSLDPELDAKPGTIARALSISQAATTEMAQKLSDQGLVDYTRYRELALTPAGEREAARIVRKHRLWETFLHRTLNMSLHEIHREAEMLEHQTSDFLAAKISEFLHDPQFDPHGDPIPDPRGAILHEEGQTPLSEALPEFSYEISRLNGSGEEFFEFCRNNRIALGNRVRVDRQYQDSGMTEIRIHDRTLLLNRSIAAIIFVKQPTVEVLPNQNYP